MFSIEQRARPSATHVHEDRACERGMRSDLVEQCTQAGADTLGPVAGLDRERSQDARFELVLASTVSGEKALLLAGELPVEGTGRDASSTHNVGDRGLGIAACGAGLADRREQALSLMSCHV